MAGRPMNEIIPYPKNDYQYVLYKVTDKTTHLSTIRTLLNGTTAETKTRVIPIKLYELLAKFGHSETTKFLKEFGPSWVCKEGVIFYDQKSERQHTF